MIDARTAAQAPSSLAMYHTRQRPPESRWYPARHILELEAEIAARITEPGGRLIISCPPRHSKTTSLEYAMAHHLGSKPDRSVLFATHSADLAATVGGRVRDVIQQSGPDVFGVNVDPRSSAKDHWGIDGHQGSLRAVGWGGDLTGRGGDLLIADDLVRTAEEAMSPAHTEKLLAWWQGVFMSRCEPGASVILCSARWPDDLDRQADGNGRAPVAGHQLPSRTR